MEVQGGKGEEVGVEVEAALAPLIVRRNVPALGSQKTHLDQTSKQ